MSSSSSSSSDSDDETDIRHDLTHQTSKLRGNMSMMELMEDMEKSRESEALVGVNRRHQGARGAREAHRSGKHSSIEGYASSQDLQDDHERRKRFEGMNAAKETREKRRNKNAPAEASSKKRVKRRRDIEIQGAAPEYKPQDPRFNDLHGKFSSQHFYTNYDFLDKQQEQEVEKLSKVLKSNKVKSSHNREELRAKLLHTKQEMTERRRATRQMERLSKLKQEEREKVAAGKTPYFLKQSAIKELALEDRYQELKGKGKGKVSKFLEKRRRKNAAKDRKWMPEGGGGDGDEM